MIRNRFAIYAWVVLIYLILVILWGAYVRATGSGAGCGSHWPLCNGVVIPRSPEFATFVEFTHRLMSGISLILILIMFYWALRLFPRTHLVRNGATFSLIFVFTEALVGAGLVLFEWVAGDTSSGRVIAMALHLVNTFLLLASISLTAWWASQGVNNFTETHKMIVFVFGLGLLGVLILGISGAVNALGDTLFPALSLADGFTQDFSPTAHFLLRLRLLHPVLAMLTGFYLILVGGLVSLFYEEPIIKRISIILIAFIILQLVIGLVNLVLLAPIGMQIVHLLLADLVWISLVLLSAACNVIPFRRYRQHTSSRV